MCYTISMETLTVEAIRKLFPSAGPRHYDKNQIICYHGDKPQYVFYVNKGHVKYYDIDEHGNEKILHINGPQNIFPMLYAFGMNAEINGFYGGIDKVELIAIPLDVFHKVIESNVEFSNQLVQWLLADIEQLAYRLNSLEKTEAKLKILYALKTLALNYGKPSDKWVKIDFPVTQQFVADFTGLARETVSSAMSNLEKEKILRTGKLRSLEVKQEELENIL